MCFWFLIGTTQSPNLNDFYRFYVIMFFRKASPQTEGRRNADLEIKLPPDCVLHCLACGFFLLFLLPVRGSMATDYADG